MDARSSFRLRQHGTLFSFVGSFSPAGRKRTYKEQELQFSPLQRALLASAAALAPRGLRAADVRA
jgi:hypothetical protein